MALLAAAPGASSTDADRDFAEDFESGTPGLALGPVPAGSVIVSADVGWLRSALRGQIGLGNAWDLVLVGDAFLLHGAFDGQNGIHAGVRLTPLQTGPFRLSIEGTVGAIFVAGRIAASNVFALRVESDAGVTFPQLGTAYVRVQLRALTDAAAGDAHWGGDAELGAGVERELGRFVVGAEGSLWTRPSLESIRQWRIRLGYQF